MSPNFDIQVSYPRALVEIGKILRVYVAMDGPPTALTRDD